MCTGICKEFILVYSQYVGTHQRSYLAAGAISAVIGTLLTKSDSGVVIVKYIRVINYNLKLT